MSISATTAPTAVVTAGSILPTGVSIPTTDVSLWQFILTDRATGTELADISFVSTGKYLKRRLSRPSEGGASIKCAEALARTLWTDGYPYLSVGRRCLKVRHRISPADPWVLWFHGVIWFLEDVGGANTGDTSFYAYDPMMMWNFRFVRDETGNMTFPTFNGGGPISGPDWIQQMCRNSAVNLGPEFDWEGDMGLDVETGLFDTAIPPAVNCQSKITNWPMTIGDLGGRLTQGPCDAWVDPVENSSFGPATIGRLNAVTRAGQPTIVHYDYGTGDHSCTVRRSLDMSTLANKLRWLLGPSEGLPKGHWRGSIEATNSGLPNPPQTALNALIDDSRSSFLVFQDLRIFDDGHRENDQRQLFMRLWQIEQLFRVEPRELLFVTPVIDAPFRVADLTWGDTITINCSDDLRQGFSAQQRLFGWNVTITDNNAEQLEELVVSADGL